MSSSTSTRCSKCGEDAVIWEEYNGSSEKQVCSACGVVYCDSNLVSNDISHTSLVSDNKFNGLPDSFVKYQIQKLPEGLKVGRTRIRTLCSTMSLGSSYVTEALQLFDKLYQTKDFKMCMLEKKSHLATWCVYISCRKASLPITMHYVANITGHEVHKLFRIHNYCKNVLSMDIAFQDVTECIDTVLKQELSSNVQYSQTTIQLTKDIVMLCKELWLTEGRQSRINLLAAFFIAWQAEEFVKRKKEKFTSICKKRSCSIRTCRDRIGEFKCTLVKLAKLIPWASNVTTVNVAYYVKDVIKYKYSLMRDAFKKVQNTEECGEDQELQTEPANSLGCEVSQENEGSGHNQESEGQGCSSGQDASKPENIVKSDVSNGETTNIATTTTTCECPSDVSGKASVRKPSDRVDTVNLNYSTDFMKRKDDIETDHLFKPPAFKRARRKSIEREEILHYVSEGRKMMENIASQFN